MPRLAARSSTELARYLRTETVGGALLLLAAAIALVWVNTPAGDSYQALRDFHLGPSALQLNLSIDAWAQDGLLAVFFFIAGIEVKREMVVGELSDRKSATLPVVAALGGVLTPALVALAVGWGTPGIDKAWAVPVATDIAFALGVLALTGSRLPASARVFLLSLAVVDDLVAIVIIAVLFTDGLALGWVAVALGCLAVYAYAQHRRVPGPRCTPRSRCSPGMRCTRRGSTPPSQAWPLVCSPECAAATPIAPAASSRRRRAGWSTAFSPSLLASACRCSPSSPPACR